MSQNTGEQEAERTWDELSAVNSLPPHVLYSAIAMSVVNIILSVSASLGNFLILVALHKEASLHPPSKLLFQCLTMSDLCVGVALQPAFSADLILFAMKGSRLEQWSAKSPVAEFVRIVGNALCGISLITLTSISADRLAALSYGLRYRHVVTLTRVRAVVVFVWSACIAFGVVSFVWNTTAVSYVVVLNLAMNLVVSTFCYTKLYCNLRHHQVRILQQRHQEQLNGSSPLNIVRYKNTVNNALWVHVTLVICYLPHTVVTVLSIANFTSLSVHFGVFSFSLLLLNSSLNPVLYCWRITEVRKAVKDTTEKFCCFLSS